MFIQEVFINQTKGHRYGESEWTEAFTDNVGKLFLALKREYGRCTSRVYIDPVGGGKPKAIGWTFEKRMEYEDWRPGRGERYYIRCVWVTLADKVETVPARRTVVHHEIGIG
jgi:hypothetical protein